MSPDLQEVNQDARVVELEQRKIFTRQIDRTQEIASSAEQSIKAAKYGIFAAGALQDVFAARDIHEGWEDYEKAWNDH